MRWFTVDRLIVLNILLLALDGLAPAVLGGSPVGMGVCLNASVVLHLALLGLMVRAMARPSPSARCADPVLPASDQAWLDGTVTDQDLTEVEHRVLAVRRAQARANAALPVTP